ncbi:hypothetical protein PPERSA_12872 [Pseudocohnilembus persalinus]|uniref:Histidine phosphatase superfamily, clade-2 n=1 Tax=Pseudocohnilembus persalinus TaxID=266149 RepID=A0A0V0Q846_PSEPJ|nr:hypothetical protein PPERSA_12872 [Pseudocohnilembus persalinus]|eukprot:KRW98393.1 hypothetical protein PPERSA_12872 [Pseudocohnilembus persalinus]
MKMKQTALILIFCLFLGCFCEKKLVFMSEVSRHGARAPMYDNLNYNEWELQNSDLTQVGMRQHYLLGRQFHKYYIEEKGLLSVPFDYNQVLVKTTSTARTQKSAQAQMMGWFFEKGQNIQSWIQFNDETSLPPQYVENGKEIYEEIGQSNLPNSFQPIPTYSSPENYLNVALEPAAGCKRIGELKARNNYTPQTKQFIEYLEENGVLERFREVFGLPDNTDITIKLIGEYYDTIYCNLFQQLGLPEGVTEEDWDWIQFIYNYQQLYLNYGNELNLKLQSTAFFRELLNQARKTIYLEDKVKFMFYSASDNNVNTINLALNITTFSTNIEEWKENQLRYSNVPFASTVIFEFYEEDYEIYVLFKYNGKAYNICNVENEDYMCTFQQFEKLVSKYIMGINEWIQECRDI